MLLRLATTLALAAGSLLAANGWAQGAGKTVVTTPQVRAELMAQAPEGVEPGKPVWVGLQIAHQPGWHTYWKNSGDSGLPTVLDWTLPAGVQAGEIAWPAPKKIPIGTLANYGYEDTVLLPVPLTIGPDFKPSVLSGQFDVKLKAAWLVCRKECIPEEGEFTVSIPVKGSTGLNGAVFDAALAAHPKALQGDGTVDIQGKTIQVTVAGLPARWQGKELQFFPETPEVIETAGAWTQTWTGGVWTAQVPLATQRSNSPQVMPVVLVGPQSGAEPGAYRTEARVTGAWPQVAAAANVSPALDAALKANAAQATMAPAGAGADLTWIAAMLGALLGGLILNLMPCVFPVMAIKIIGFARHAEARCGTPSEAASALRRDGMAYTVGVILSFLALGGAMLALRAAGEQLGWGFQLQSPGVVAALAVLFTLMGLSLTGLFQFGQFVPCSVASMEAKHPAANAFLSGVLAVAIASPCTAPFMGASMGFAIALPGVQALLIFGALGVGMALPFLLASMLPSLVRLLPKPGPWMETFRRCMAFPMFATVAWLVWVLGQQSGIDGAASLLVLLVALSAVAWALTLRGRSRLVLGTISTVVAAAVLGTFGPSIVQPAQASTVARAGDRWQAWEPGRVEQLVAGGQPVMVNFTAAWCVTCQYNKKTTLSNAQVLADLEGKKVQLLQADWTRRDPAITAALNQLGRSGVPLYVIYKPGTAPVVLSEVLGVDELRSAIARL